MSSSPDAQIRQMSQGKNQGRRHKIPFFYLDFSIKITKHLFKAFQLQKEPVMKRLKQLCIPRESIFDPTRNRLFRNIRDKSILFLDDFITCGTTGRLGYKSLVALGNHVDGLIWMAM